MLLQRNVCAQHTQKYAAKGVHHTRRYDKHTPRPFRLETPAALSIRQLGHPLSPSSAPVAAFRHPSNKTAAMNVTVKLCCVADPFNPFLSSHYRGPALLSCEAVMTRRRSTTRRVTNVKFNQLIGGTGPRTRNAAETNCLSATTAISGSCVSSSANSLRGKRNPRHIQ